MIELFKNKIYEAKYQKISFDFKLMSLYILAMMSLLVIHPIENSHHQFLFAFILMIILVIISFGYKIKTKWIWQGLTEMSILKFIFHIVFACGFFIYIAYFMTSTPLPDLKNVDIPTFLMESLEIVRKAVSNPHDTPWFLSGIGSVVFNLLSSLNLVSTKE
ncbi:MAG: hypothetical protein WC836_14015 [Desulfobacula sp.]